MAKNAYLANASMAVCASLIASAMFLTSIFFYFIFGEKINLQQVVGMLIMMAAVFAIASNPNKNG